MEFAFLGIEGQDWFFRLHVFTPAVLHSQPAKLQQLLWIRIASM